MATSANLELGQDAPERLRDRLWRAFSLRRNLHLLFVPPQSHLRPIDGWRAISILWVVVFHTAWYSLGNIPMANYSQMVFSSWMLPVWRGDFGVDIFFVISGFLIAGMLLDERERTGRLRLGLFYVRRLMRLWPALFVAAIVNVTVLHDNPWKLWANLLYVSNFFPIYRLTMVWTWSLAIEEQFYLVCPWLVKALARLTHSARMLALGAVAFVLLAVGVRVVLAGDFHALDSEIVINRDIIVWVRGFERLYVKPWMRAGPLLMGVVAAYLFRSPRVMESIARKRVFAAVGFALALGIAVVSTHWQYFAKVPRVVEIAYLVSYRTAFGAAIAYMVLLSLSQHPMGKWLGRALSSRILYPIGQLAYSAYLLNPIVAMRVHHDRGPLVGQGLGSPMGLFLPLDVGITFLGAAALYLFVERPSMELRPKAEQIRAS